MAPYGTSDPDDLTCLVRWYISMSVMKSSMSGWSSAQSIDWNVAGPHQYPFSCEVWNPFMRYDDPGTGRTVVGTAVGVP